MLLTRYENEGVLHVALVSRGNEKLSTELLQRQAEILTSIYGNASESTEESLESSMTISPEDIPEDTAAPSVESPEDTPTEDTETEQGGV